MALCRFYERPETVKQRTSWAAFIAHFSDIHEACARVSSKTEDVYKSCQWTFKEIEQNLQGCISSLVLEKNIFVDKRYKGDKIDIQNRVLGSCARFFRLAVTF